jgi:hypothetical protein
MMKQSFGSIWHRAIMQRTRWNGWSRKTSNLPWTQPTEHFWALLARAVYAKGWEAQNKAELCGRQNDDERRSNKATQNRWQWTVGGYVNMVFKPHNIVLLKNKVWIFEVSMIWKKSLFT